MLGCSIKKMKITLKYFRRVSCRLIKTLFVLIRTFRMSLAISKAKKKEEAYWFVSPPGA